MRKNRGDLLQTQKLLQLAIAICDLFNFSIINDFTYRTIRWNRGNNVPDYNKVFVWSQDKKLVERKR